MADTNESGKTEAQVSEPAQKADTQAAPAPAGVPAAVSLPLS
jgi:hypothetical protein